MDGLPEDSCSVCRELWGIDDEQHMLSTIASFSTVTKHLTELSGEPQKWYVIRTDPQEQMVEMWSFSAKKIQEAQSHYAKLETGYEDHDSQVVMVSSDSFNSMKQAYPAFFADSHNFVANVRSQINERIV